MDFDAIITRTEGYLELGLPQKAWDTLESLPPESKGHPKVYLLHLGILVLGEHWAKAEILAESLAIQFPRNSSIWLSLAKAQAGLGKIEIARRSAKRVSEIEPLRRLEMLADPQLKALWQE